MYYTYKYHQSSTSTLMAQHNQLIPKQVVPLIIREIQTIMGIEEDHEYPVLSSMHLLKSRAPKEWVEDGHLWYRYDLTSRKKFAIGFAPSSKRMRS